MLKRIAIVILPFMTMAMMSPVPTIAVEKGYLRGCAALYAANADTCFTKEQMDTLTIFTKSQLDTLSIYGKSENDSLSRAFAEDNLTIQLLEADIKEANAKPKPISIDWKLTAALVLGAVAIAGAAGYVIGKN